MCRPNLSFRFFVLAQTTSPTPKHAKFLNATVEISLSAKLQGLRFVHRDPEAVHFVLLSDASFASNADFRQTGISYSPY